MCCPRRKQRDPVCETDVLFSSDPPPKHPTPPTPQSRTQTIGLVLLLGPEPATRPHQRAGPSFDLSRHNKSVMSNEGAARLAGSTRRPSPLMNVHGHHPAPHPPHTLVFSGTLHSVLTVSEPQYNASRVQAGSHDPVIYWLFL